MKASLVHEKNPAQHAADLEVLKKFEETRFAMAKSIECVRVDGAAMLRSNSRGQKDTLTIASFVHSSQLALQEVAT